MGIERQSPNWTDMPSSDAIDDHLFQDKSKSQLAQMHEYLITQAHPETKVVDREIAKMEDPGVVSHWCFVCSQAVNPLTEAEIKCPQCESKFLQEMGSPRISSHNAVPNREDRVPIWSPILLGLIGAAGDEDSPPNSIASGAAHIGSDVDQAEEHSAEGFIELSFWRNSHDDPSSESGSMDLEDDWDRSTLDFADYFLGTDLDVLQWHLLGLDRHSRFYESTQARKAVDDMPMVTIKENTHCSICLEDFEMGGEAKEMGCKHIFHGWCIFSWLELHRSCPLCRCRVSPDSASRLLPLTGQPWQICPVNVLTEF